MSVIPVVLCGGSGSRIWPLSREEYPKQFIQLCGEQSFLQQTIARLAGLSAATAPIFISNTEQRFLLADQVRQMGIDKARIVLEPVARNTAPAVAAAAMIAMAEDKDAVLLVLPSDHLIQNNKRFQALVDDANALAQDNYLVTFGITPDCAHTGYGYIQKGELLSERNTAYTVQAFIEKPELQQAKELIKGDAHYWNSGMFAFKAALYLEELARLQPDMLRQVEQAVAAAQHDPDFMRLDSAAFSACPADSIDYAVMEHTQKAALLIANDLGWSDVGSWDALAAISPADEQGNHMIGDVVAEEVKNCYLRSENRLLAAIGLEDVVVVETADAVLVAHKSKVQHVKKLVEQLSKKGRPEVKKHRKVYRPWGCYDSIDAGSRFQVKRIVVNPGASLSLQMHFHRAEHWVVVKGTARITNGDNVILLTENQSTYIPIGTKHRLENPGKFPLELIEIQSGGYLGEDDIVRFDDVYGRSEVSKVLV
ncbi:MAG: mannose-1-phosphate guanylyltransferase/mannose-6-phosphate isomerase [Legionella sp.]|nr:mannose-1-phosphate guanylyltransferase/mannose-6-phosphate isomerase [Legionella sp.]